MWKAHYVISLKRDTLGNAVEERIPIDGYEVEVM